MKQPPSKPLFSLGQIVQTQGVAQALNPLVVMGALVRHQRGDWGEVCAEDKSANNAALSVGRESRILSAYTCKETNQKFWIITEWDRSLTTVLFPSEY